MRKTVFLRRQQQRIQPLREATNWEEVNETSFWSLKDQPNVDPSERQRELGCCCGCMGRMPFATLIATLMCCAGVGVFLFAMHRGLTATIKMFEVVFQYRMLGTTHVRLQDLQVGFIAVGAGMGMLALLILLIGCLSTGSTRTSVYKDWKARAGGRFTCIFLMTFTYLLKLTWIFICVSMAIISFVFFCWTGMCNRLKPTNLDLNKQCIDLRQFDFLLPEVSREHQNISCVCRPTIRASRTRPKSRTCRSLKSWTRTRWGPLGQREMLADTDENKRARITATIILITSTTARPL